MREAACLLNPGSAPVLPAHAALSPDQPQDARAARVEGGIPAGADIAPGPALH